MAELGTAGVLPTAGLDARLAAVTAGDLDGALAGAAATSGLLAGAEEVGRGRAVAIGVAVVGLDAAYPAAAPHAATTLAATPDPARAGAAQTSAATQSAPGADPD